jgi:shikimate dehydrogenase
MLRVGIIGDPVAQSRSPAMQNAAFAALGIAAHYARWLTPAADLAERVAALRMEDVLGANVTIPHKLAVLPLLDEIAPSAQAVGAVNTIVRQGARLIGHNTDAAGLAAALLAVGWHGMEQAIVLGAGGAARAVVVALRSLGARTICVLARNPAAAQALVETLAAQMTEVALLWGNIADPDLALWGRMLAGTEIIVNATPVGMAAQPEMPIAEAVLDRVRAGTLVLDLITQPTALLAAAKARQLPTLDGLPMLLHQGALAFTLWIGQPAPLDVMWQALLAAHH